MHATKKARLASICSAVLLVGAQLLSPFAILVPKAAAHDYVEDGKITICHRTDSYSNPYRQITIDVNGVTNGNNDSLAHHYGEHNGPIFYPTIRPPCGAAKPALAPRAENRSGQPGTWATCR